MNSITSIAIKLFYWYCKILGLCPLHYDSRKKSFICTWREISYSLLIWLSFSYFYWTKVLDLISHLNPVLVYIYFSLNLFTIATVFVVQCLNAGKLADLLNQVTKLFLLNEFKAIRDSLSLWQIVRYGIQFFYKIILINGITSVVTMVFCETLSIIVTGQIDYLVNFVMSMAYILQMIISNIFYAFILMISIHLHQLNVEIKKIRNQANEMAVARTLGDLGDDDDGIKRNHMIPNLNDQFIQLNQRLNHLSKLHCNIETIARQVNLVFSWQLLNMICNLITNILIEVISIQAKNRHFIT